MTGYIILIIIINLKTNEESIVNFNILHGV